MGRRGEGEGVAREKGEREGERRERGEGRGSGESVYIIICNTFMYNKIYYVLFYIFIYMSNRIPSPEQKY